MKKDIFKIMSPGGQFSFLLLFFFFGMLFSAIATIFLLSAAGTKDIFALSVNTLKWMQTIQTFIMFLLPALLCAYLFQENGKDYLTLSRAGKPIHLMLAFLIMICIQPFINWLGYYNQQLTLPETMSGLETAIRTSEDSANRLTALFLSDNSPVGFASALLVVGLIAAVCEEIFFRGTLQQILTKLCGNTHAAIWITAIIFSTIHFQFYGFIPRMLLGALLGYIFVWSGSLWVSILAHFINNASAIILHYLYNGTPMYDKLQKIGTEQYISYTVYGSVLTLFFIFLFFRTRKKAG